MGLGAEGAWCLVKMLQYWGEARVSWGGYMSRWGVTGRGVAVWGRAGRGGAGVPRLGVARGAVCDDEAPDQGRGVARPGASWGEVGRPFAGGMTGGVVGWGVAVRGGAGRGSSRGVMTWRLE